ncbi:glycosyltransferase family 2 protein [Brevibacillus migulae]|uniref:glycosyltransferase family 2 protein n=1 Tax=Brevibacillus migulae TaxID=1644114 RepID=UPI001431C3F9|nr:glycosyltransferase family A protein [Brevibacillus migulae]
MNVAICITTYKRPEGLKRLLDALEILTFSKSAPANIRVVVVDNDPAEGEKAFCQKRSETYRWPLTYVCEHNRGISYARNRAIAAVIDDTDCFAFIDDDEVPEPQWLDELLSVYMNYKADVVTGPVLSVFEGQVPAWVIKGKFFDRPRYATGTDMRFAASGNVLIRTNILRSLPAFFDERLSLTGGEDTHFFMRLVKLGYRIVWADQAVVHEYVPQTRVNLQWIAKRDFRTGNTITFCELDLSPSLAIRIKRIVFGTGKIVQGILQFLCSPVLGKHVYAYGVKHMYRGFGMLAAIVGGKYEEYR